MLPTKVSSQLAFGFRRSEKRFSRWPPWQPSWISHQHDFSYFWSTSHPDTSYQIWSQLAFRLRKWSEKQIFKMAAMAAISDPIGTILAIFDLQVTLMLPTKFQVNWHLGLGEKVKNRFSRWPPWWPSWIYDQHDFSYFLSTSHPNASRSYQVSSQLAFQCRRRSEK